MGKVNTQPINAYLAYFFQPEYKHIFTDELPVSGSELLCFGEIPEKNDKKNGINNAEQSEIDILSPFDEWLFEKEYPSMKLPWSLLNGVLNNFHLCYRRLFYINFMSET